MADDNKRQIKVFVLIGSFNIVDANTVKTIAPIAKPINLLGQI